LATWLAGSQTAINLDSLYVLTGAALPGHLTQLRNATSIAGSKSQHLAAFDLFRFGGLISGIISKRPDQCLKSGEKQSRY
jgi:hypothetical protein